MKNIESIKTISDPEQFKTMNCDSTEKPISELKKEGWKYEWSFHKNFKEQWNDACSKVESLQQNGDWEVILVEGQNETERKDGVAYIYKRETPQRIKREKQQGYL